MPGMILASDARRIFRTGTARILADMKERAAEVLSEDIRQHYLAEVERIIDAL